MQNNLKKGNDNGIAQRGNGAGETIQINKVVKTYPLLFTKQSFGRDEFLKGNDESAQRDVHIDKDKNDRRQKHEMKRKFLPECFQSGRSLVCSLHETASSSTLVFSWSSFFPVRIRHSVAWRQCVRT